MTLNFMDLLRKRRLNILRRTNKELEKQIDLQTNLNELLKEENEIQSQSS